MKTKAASSKKAKKVSGQLTIGIDIGDLWSHYCTLSEGGEVIEEGRGYGHEVIVANVQELQAISRSDRKSDRVDAEKLARYARLDPSILRPITHRSVAMQQDLTVVSARDVLVRLRTATINAVRGLVSIARSKPTAFQAVSFERFSTRMREWRSTGIAGTRCAISNITWCGSRSTVTRFCAAKRRSVPAI